MWRNQGKYISALHSRKAACLGQPRGCQKADLLLHVFLPGSSTSYLTQPQAGVSCWPLHPLSGGCCGATCSLSVVPQYNHVLLYRNRWNLTCREQKRKQFSSNQEIICCLFSTSSATLKAVLKHFRAKYYKTSILPYMVSGQDFAAFFSFYEILKNKRTKKTKNTKPLFYLPFNRHSSISLYEASRFCSILLGFLLQFLKHKLN